MKPQNPAVLRAVRKALKARRSRQQLVDLDWRREIREPSAMTGDEADALLVFSEGRLPGSVIDASRLAQYRKPRRDDLTELADIWTAWFFDADARKFQVGPVQGLQDRLMVRPFNRYKRRLASGASRPAHS